MRFFDFEDFLTNLF